MSDYPKAIGPNKDILALDADDEARKLAALEPAPEHGLGAVEEEPVDPNDDLGTAEPPKRGRKARP